MKKVLLIDDDDSYRRVLEYNLETEGYEVLTASSGEDGLAAFHEQNPDLIITDMKMNGMSGLELLEAVKKVRADTRVIVITACGTADTAAAVMMHGACDCLIKPFKRDILNQAVRKAFT
ncbi:MAG: response regulator [Deltaproteobacteria bacterium]|nr:response regulator [Deltaproteobacteria bacterium]